MHNLFFPHSVSNTSIYVLYCNEHLSRMERCLGAWAFLSVKSEADSIQSEKSGLFICLSLLSPTWKLTVGWTPCLSFPQWWGSIALPLFFLLSFSRTQPQVPLPSPGLHMRKLRNPWKFLWGLGASSSSCTQKCWNLRLKRCMHANLNFGHYFSVHFQCNHHINKLFSKL